jgi:hypothetical protein
MNVEIRLSGVHSARWQQTANVERYQLYRTLTYVGYCIQGVFCFLLHPGVLAAHFREL